MKTGINQTQLRILIVVAVLSFCIVSCGNDDDTGQANLAPEAFELIGVTNNAIQVGLFPTFSWNDAIDPDGDVITYSLILDTEQQPTTQVETSLNSNFITLSDRLKLLTTYYWKVIATDSLGNSTESDTYSFTTRDIGFSPDPLIENAAFPAREAHSTIVFNDELYIIHGGISFEHFVDVWTSNNGQNWTLKNNNTGFAGRTLASTIVFEDELWLIGGRTTAGSRLNDVRRSANGSNWSLATSAAPFTGRSGHSSVVFNDKMWVIGGNDNSGNLNDVWSSTDGVNWALETAGAQFSARLNHECVVFDNKLWVIGGFAEGSFFATDVWYSSDGVNWVESSNNAPFSEAGLPTSVFLDEKLWVFGPSSVLGSTNLWHTTDGNNWTLAVENVPFSFRELYSATVFNEKIYVIGGTDSSGKLNDVWVFE